MAAGFGFNLCEDDYSFVLRKAIMRPRLHRHLCDRPARTRIYKTTVVVKNTYVIKKSGIVNKGIPKRNVERATKRPIRQGIAESKPRKEPIRRKTVMDQKRVERQQKRAEKKPH